MSNLCSSSSSSSASSSTSSASNSTDNHKNEGFLKSAWHRLTHQHDNPTDDSKPGEKSEEEEPKKASGSG